MLSSGMASIYALTLAILGTVFAITFYVADNAAGSDYITVSDLYHHTNKIAGMTTSW